MRIVFMGTPDFAAAILGRLLDWKGGQVAAVYAQPDRPCGRGLKCTPPPTKLLALEHDIPVLQPKNFREPNATAELAALSPDVLVVAAYGLILPQAVLDIPRLMPVNVHASLLPKYRGAAPIQRAILNGDTVTGVTIMRMEAALDTGPILLQRSLVIGQDDTAQDLHDQLATLGANLLIQALERLQAGSLNPIPQDDSRATYAPKLAKEEGRIDFTRTSRQVHDQVRAMTPWPGAYTEWTAPNSKPLRLTLAPGQPGNPTAQPATPGELLGLENGLLAFACGDGHTYLVPAVTPQGRKPQSAESFACGYLHRCL